MVELPNTHWKFPENLPRQFSRNPDMDKKYKGLDWKYHQLNIFCQKPAALSSNSNMVGLILSPPQVGIGWTDLPNIGGADSSILSSLTDQSVCFHLIFGHMLSF